MRTGRRFVFQYLATRPCTWRQFSTTAARCFETSQGNIIEIDRATFYKQFDRQVDGPNNSAFFSNLSFTLPGSTTTTTAPEYWSVVSPSSLARTTFLQVLAGQHTCHPPTARRYPALSRQSISPLRAIKYVGFDADRGSSVSGTDVRGAYLSARYESRREETDFSVHDYLTGNTELNPMEREDGAANDHLLHETVKRLNLGPLLHMPVSNLSNGQTRRVRIAKALMARPEVLLLDGPFMGLDPNTLARMTKVLYQLASEQSPRLVLSLRPDDQIPDWISHIVFTNRSLEVVAQGPKAGVLEKVYNSDDIKSADMNVAAPIRLSRDGFPSTSPATISGEPLIEMSGVKVAYNDRIVLGDWSQEVDGKVQSGLWWNLCRGQRCGIFGANGSGKTTMLSLITSDHPQTYSLPIKLFGRSRLPGPGEPGISIFDLQRRMGHSSPEVHAFFPKQLSTRRTLESAWADAPLSRPTLDHQATSRVDSFLRWFERELNPKHTGTTSIEALEQQMGEDTTSAIEAYAKHDTDLKWASELRFWEMSFSSQRLLLFLRAIIASPDLVILDEALSGLDEQVRDKALLFLSHGEKVKHAADGSIVPSALAECGKICFEGLGDEQALLIISHAREDVPGCVREWICLPEPGEGRPPRLGVLAGPLELNPQGWNHIWGAEG